MIRTPRAASLPTGSVGDSNRVQAVLMRASRPRARVETTSGRAATAARARPPGHGRHRYAFRLYALDGEPELEAGTAKAQLERAIEGHVLTTAELVGTYER